MRIAQIYTDFDKGGAQRVILDISKGIKKKSDEIILISDEGVMLNEVEENGIINYKLPLTSRNLIDIYKSIVGLNRIIKKHNIQIINSHHRFTTVLSLIVSKINKIKVVHTEHNIFTNKNFLNLRGENIIAVSEKVKENMILNNVPKKNIKVIRNGVKLKKYPFKDYRKEYNISQNDKVIGIIARLSKEKGHEYFLNSLNEVIKKENLKVFFVGDGEEKNNILNLINKYKIKENVIMLGNINDIENIISACDIFVLPSEYEGLPISILEIMSKGKIIIATDVGGNSEVIKDRENGYLIKSNNEESLKSTLNLVLKDYKKLDSLKNNAQKTIENKFSLELMIKNYMDYYGEIING